ncbi:MAG TPA: energy transducer TonB [Cyclobacteriaceae bacterium]|nr:energy transducer TonB [Cyclobacteriaceae bacterium]
MELKKNPASDVHRLRGVLFSLSLTISLGVVITAFEWKSKGDGGSVDLAQYDTVGDELLEIPVTEQTPPPPAPSITPKIVEVPDEEEIAEEIDVVIDVEMKETSDAIKVTHVEEMAKEETDEVFLIVEEDPQFPGGTGAFAKFIKDNLHYPRNARQMGIEGKVFVQAIVAKDGSLTDLQVLKGMGAGCDEEALRVVAKSPKWKPGLQRGHPVRTRIVIPLVFKLG